jgi:ankyrin repeat protein
VSDLPVRPSLTSLRKQAKALLNGFRNEDPGAFAAVREHHPKPDQFSSLRDAQLVIARQYEHPGWQELVDAVGSALDDAKSLDERADLFADLACLRYSPQENIRDRERAARLLEETQGLTKNNLYAAAAASEVETLQAMIEADPDCVNRDGGPRNWPPAMYLAYSRVHDGSDGRDPVAAMKVLLDAGADPRFAVDGTNPSERRFAGGWHWTLLTGVIGEGESGDVQQSPHPKAREMAVMLLDAGADPNDSQGLYNCHFTPGTEWLELLLSYGLDATAPTNPDDLSEETTLNYQLAAAVRTGYVDCVRLLLEHGADASGRDDRYTNQTYVEDAVAGGYRDILDLLVEHGAAQPELSSADRFRFAVVASDEGEAKRLLAEDAGVIDQSGLMVNLARRNRVDAAKLLLDLGADPNRMNDNGRGAMHEAAWSGHREMIEVLLEGGGRLEVRSEAHGGSAVGYANHAGRFELRDFLLEQTRDVQDLVSYNRAERLDAVLSDEPGLIGTVGDDGASLMDMAKKKEHASVIEVLERHGAVA